MKKFVTLILLLSQLTTSALAGLPPTAVQGQSDATPQTKFNFQVPYSQKTDLGGVKALFETGNRNLLANPSFEHTTATTSWTTTKLSGTTFTSAVDSTNFLDGKQSLTGTLTAATGEISQDVTPGIQTLGVNMEATCWVKTALTDVSVCARSAGADLSGCVTAPSTNTWSQVVVNFPGPANGTSVGVGVKNASAETGTFNPDDCYVGPARNVLQGVQPVGPWISTTGLVPNNFGTVTSNTYLYRRVGDSYEANMTFNAGTLVAATASVTLPYAIDSTKLPSNSFGTVLGTYVRGQTSGGSQNLYGTFTGVVFYDGSDATKLYFAQQINSSGLLNKDTATNLFNSSQPISVHFLVPTTAFGSMSALQNPDQSDFGWTAVTPTISGLGTTANQNCFEKRVGDTMYYQCSLTCGTVAAANVAVPMPTGLAIDSTKIGSNASGTQVGSWTRIPTAAGNANAYASTQEYYVFYDGSDTSKVYVGQFTNTAAFVKNTGSALFGTGETETFSFSVPIAQWVNTNRAPNLIGSETSADSVKSYRIESAQVTVSNAAAAIVSQSGSWLSVANGAGVGLTTGTITAAEFSSAPSCTCTVIGAASTSASHCIFTAEPTTTTLLISRNRAGAAENGDVNIMCMGTR